MEIAIIASLVMVIAVVMLLIIGAPIGVAIGAASTLSMLIILPFDSATATSAQKMFTGLNSFPLLAIPFFVLAGNIMNNGGIAIRMIHLAEALCGKMPGSLAQSNVVANMFFGAISGSGNAAAAAMGGTLGPVEAERGYDVQYSTAVNIASAPTGMLIPPSNALIVFTTVATSVSVAGIFMAGYIPGILWGISVMIVAGYTASKRGYVTSERVTAKQTFKYFLDAIPSLLLVIIVIGGILKGIFTATEASGIAVAYALILSFIYKSIKIKDLPKIIFSSAQTTAIIVFLIAVSSIMSWVMAYTDIPGIVANAMLAITNNKIVTLLIINLVLLFVGTFMDPTPAILIFTPIFMPICVDNFGMSAIHFGILICFNLCIGSITPPVGTILFTGCKIGNTSIESVFKSLLPYFAAIAVVLMLVTYIPAISEFLPRMFGYL
ncbi:MAG: TRAP transporter large permease [Lachnospiraceae bacterium]|nr:TRAP transporter large permease [Lachnospiraceae bacterium]